MVNAQGFGMTRLTASRRVQGGLLAGLAIAFGSVVLLASTLPAERAAAQTGFRKIAAPKSNVPRPPGSNARVCANQEKDAATYRIDSCSAIIATAS